MLCRLVLLANIAGRAGGGFGALPLCALAHIGIVVRLLTLPVADEQAQASRAGAQNKLVRRKGLSNEARPRTAMLLLCGLYIEPKDAVCTFSAAE